MGRSSAKECGRVPQRALVKSLNRSDAFVAFLGLSVTIGFLTCSSTMVSGQAVTPKGTRNDRWPHFSPDGKYIAFTSNREGPLQVYVMSADGAGLHSVGMSGLPSMQFFCAGWFADGDLLTVAFRPAALNGQDNDFEATSFIKSSPNGQGGRIMFQGMNAERPQASPNGSSIVFEQEHGSFASSPPIDLAAVDSRTLSVRTLTHGDGQYVQAAWSPVGDKIAYACGAAAAVQLGICVMNADGPDSHLIAHGVGSYQWPAWSPDGERVAFFIEAAQNGHTDSSIAVVNGDGSNQTVITKHAGPQRDEAPSWSPDGQHIAFQTDRLGGGLRIAVMRPDGTDVKVLQRE